MTKRWVCTKHYDFCGDNDIIKIVSELNCEICIIKKEKRPSPAFVGTDLILEFDRLKEENKKLKEVIRKHRQKPDKKGD